MFSRLINRRTTQRRPFLTSVLMLILTAGNVNDGITNPVLGRPNILGADPDETAVNATNNRIYMSTSGDNRNTVNVIDGSANTLLGGPIPVGHLPEGIAVNATTNRIYVVNVLDNTVSVIDGSTNTVLGNPIPVGKSAQDGALTGPRVDTPAKPAPAG